MSKKWDTSVDRRELESELTFKEVIKLRKQCQKMYDCLKFVNEVLADAYERPKVNLPDDVEKLMTSCRIIIGHIEQDN